MKIDRELPSEYRALYMLKPGGKVLEMLIRSRLAETTHAAENRRSIAREIHGYAAIEVLNSARRIVLLAKLDVRVAFNSVR